MYKIKFMFQYFHIRTIIVIFMFDGQWMKEKWITNCIPDLVEPRPWSRKISLYYHIYSSFWWNNVSYCPDNINSLCLNFQKVLVEPLLVLVLVGLCYTVLMQATSECIETSLWLLKRIMESAKCYNVFQYSSCREYTGRRNIHLVLHRKMLSKGHRSSFRRLNVAALFQVRSNLN